MKAIGFFHAFPRLLYAEAPSLSLLQYFNIFIFSTAVIESVPQKQGYRKETQTFSTLIVGLGKDRTRPPGFFPIISVCVNAT
jgi:hypothetical protein